MAPRRDDRHRARPRGVDDLEDGGGRHPARRRQGRRDVQPERAVAERAGTPRARLHPAGRPDSRRDEGRAGARRLHHASDHGVDDGRVRGDPAGGPPGSNHRETAPAWRIAGAGRRDRARGNVYDPRSGEGARHRAEGRDGRGPGLRKRGAVRRPARGGIARSQDHRGVGFPGRCLQSGRYGRESACRAQARHEQDRGIPGRQAHHE